jgi:curved DNA-binding protein CbpA
MYNRIKIIYLKSATNLQELKKLYFKLAKELYPDITKDNGEKMKQLNNEFDYLKTVLKNAVPKTEQEKNQYRETSASMDAFREILNKLLRYPKITIEIIGSWLWISGSGTFAIKDSILYSDLKCKYSKSQKKFYWYSGIENSQGNFKGGFLKNAIAAYGVIKMESESMPELV